VAYIIWFAILFAALFAWAGLLQLAGKVKQKVVTKETKQKVNQGCGWLVEKALIAFIVIGLLLTGLSIMRGCGHPVDPDSFDSHRL
jgi:hypothetical protein